MNTKSGAFVFFCNVHRSCVIFIIGSNLWREAAAEAVGVNWAS